MRPALFTSVLAALLLACLGPGCSRGTGSADPTPEALSASAGLFTYRVRVEPTRGVLRAELCFPRGRPARLALVKPAGADFLRWAATADGRPLERRGGTFLLGADAGTAGCVQYGVDLLLAARASRHVWRRGDDLLASSGVWLLRPDPLPEEVRATLRFELPAGIRALAPWPSDGGVHRLDATAFRWHGHVAFGRFRRRSIELPQTRLVYARLGEGADPSKDVVRRWLRGAAEAVSHIHGRFPTRRVAVVVVPVPPGADPVAFGMVHRGGGGSVALLLRRGAEEEALVRDWVAPHEFSHLALPLVRREDAWLSEGLATYYQEVTRARAGLLEPLQAWRHIDAGFARGSRSGTGRTLRGESEAMFETGAFRRVYWAGTAFALEADMRLRAEHGTSLDAAVAAFAAQFPLHRRTWSAAEVVRRMDAVSGTRVFSRLARRYLSQTDFPETEPLFEQLGLVRGAEGDLVLDDGAPHAALRDSIMAGSAGEGPVRTARSGTGAPSARGR